MGENWSGRAAVVRSSLDLLSEEEMAEALGIKTETLAAWRNAEKGPDYAKLGKGVFYRRKDVVEWVNANIVLTRRA